MNDYCRKQLYLEHADYKATLKRLKNAGKGVYDEAVNVASKGIEKYAPTVKRAATSIWDPASNQYKAWKKDYNAKYYQQHKDYWKKYYEQIKSGVKSAATSAVGATKQQIDKYAPTAREAYEKARNSRTGQQIERYARDAYSTAKPYLNDLGKAAESAYGAARGDLGNAASSIRSAANKAYNAAATPLNQMYNRFMGSSAGAEAKKAYQTAQNVVKNAFNDLTALHQAGASDAAKLGKSILKQLSSISF